MAKTVLVTGISGFIAKHVALEFLKTGYKVGGTVRSKAKGKKVAETLKKHFDKAEVEIFEADLSSDAGWKEAVKGCDVVAHVASPFPLAQPKDENELIKPAVEGTLRVLRAAKAARVKRFVQTSSLVAVMFGHAPNKLSFNEDDWSVVDGPGMSPYNKSKTLAEKAARDFIAEEGSDIHFSTVNPGLVMGPPLDSDFGASLELVQMFLKGKFPGAPRVKMPCVDVRDIAKMHVLAAETGQPSGGRYLGCAEMPWFVEVGKALHKGLGEKAKKAPKRELPNFMVKLVALFDPTAKLTVPDLGLDRKLDNSRTKKALGIEFIPVEDAAVASGKSLIEHGLA